MTASWVAETHVEGKVGLPDRWVPGCAEVPALASRMEIVTTLRGAAVARLLGDLPSVAPPGPVRHLVTVGGDVRVVPGRIPGGVAITGTSRLAAAARVSRFADSLTVYAGPHDSSAWVFQLPGGRLTLVLSPGPYRGFSGEGGLLTLLADPDAERHGRTLAHALSWNPTIDLDRIADETGLSPEAVRAGLAWLSASGRVGFDLTDGAYFHRDLPIDADQVLRRSPRLRSARRLVERGAVVADGAGWLVRGDHDTYRVVEDRCSCPWEIEHQGSRGPCKHLLAVALVRTEART